MKHTILPWDPEAPLVSIHKNTRIGAGIDCYLLLDVYRVSGAVWLTKSETALTGYFTLNSINATHATGLQLFIDEPWSPVPDHCRSLMDYVSKRFAVYAVDPTGDHQPDHSVGTVG